MRCLLALTVLATMLYIASAGAVNVGSSKADDLLAVDAGGAHAEASARQARQFGFFQRLLGGGGFFGPRYGGYGGGYRGYGGYGGYGGGYGGYGGYGRGFGGPFGFFG